MGSTIVAGNFEESTHATDAVKKLVGAGVPPKDVCVFFLTPPGQHDVFPGGGDRDKSPGATQSDSGAWKGAAVGGVVGLGAGAAVAAGLGPIAILAGIGVGAYTGSLVGALGKSGKNQEPEKARAPAEPRHAGMVVAVRISKDAPRNLAAQRLREEGARDIEEAQGTWRDGKWEDFDPLSKPEPVGTAQRLSTKR